MMKRDWDEGGYIANPNNVELNQRYQRLVRVPFLRSRGALQDALHKDATIFGYVGADLFAGPIQQLFPAAPVAASQKRSRSPKLAIGAKANWVPFSF